MTEYLADVFKACTVAHVDTIYSETTNSTDVLPTCSYTQQQMLCGGKGLPLMCHADTKGSNLNTRYG